MSRRPHTVGDVAELPDYAFGPPTLSWWGVVGFMLIEGMAFVLAIGAYYYLLPYDRPWPPNADPPPLFWSTLFTVLVVASEVPNTWIKHAAKKQELAKVKTGLVLMTAIGIAAVAVRFFEFAALNVRWDTTAYGSITWALIALHAFHLIVDVWDTAVLAVLTHKKKVDGRKFSDVADNAMYWRFIIWSWVVLYVVVYWTPRWV